MSLKIYSASQKVCKKLESQTISEGVIEISKIYYEIRCVGPVEENKLKLGMSFTSKKTSIVGLSDKKTTIYNNKYYSDKNLNFDQYNTPILLTENKLYETPRVKTLQDILKKKDIITNTAINLLSKRDILEVISNREITLLKLDKNSILMNSIVMHPVWDDLSESTRYNIDYFNKIYENVDNNENIVECYKIISGMDTAEYYKFINFSQEDDEGLMKSFFTNKIID